MKALIEEIAKALVDDPDEVRVNEISGMMTSVYELSVAKSDIGKIIGKNGRTLSAFRILVSAVGTKLKRKAVLEVLE